MSVRLRLALTVLFTGLATALGVVVAVGLAFERFEREATFARADAFLGRVVAQHADLLEQQQRAPEPFVEFLRSLLLLEPDSQLYLLASDGSVLARSGTAPLPRGFKVAVQPVRAAAAAAGQPTHLREAAYVMGDDPEYMDLHAVIAARALRRAQIQPTGASAAGYLYMVCRKPGLPPSRLARFAASLAGPALGPVLAVVLLATLLAAWIIAAVTRPLARLSHSVAEAAARGFDAEAAGPVPLPPPANVGRTGDEFTRLRHGFETLLARLSAQWHQLRRVDVFRRESVSNLSHDLRSPLTAAAAALETLQQRWRDDPGAASTEEQRLVDVALRNTHNAARLVRSLGDLAMLDEAEFRLRPERIDLAEVVDSIVMRFAERAARTGVSLHAELSAGGDPLAAEIDVELFERAIANLLDNALRHTPAGGEIVIAAALAAPPAAGHAPERIEVTVCDSGRGIAEADLARLFERRVQGEASAAAHEQRREQGSKGLGLAIVRRIVELHGGDVSLASRPGHGTTVTIVLPRPGPGASAAGITPAAGGGRH